MHLTDNILNEPIVAFMLARYPKRASVNTLAHLGLDRWPLMHTPGLRFWRLLGVGQGRSFDPHADLQRSALFTVWHTYAALKQFEAQSVLMQSIRQRALEVWTVHMRPIRWHGTWGSSDPFMNIPPVAAPEDGPWAILTRATIHPLKVRAFLRAVSPVSASLLQQPALINSVGVGEAPLIYQATFSLWSSLPDMTSFAYGPTAHVEVVRRTRRERWYTEELFARLRPIASMGTWDGINPLETPNV